MWAQELMNGFVTGKAKHGGWQRTTMWVVRLSYLSYRRTAVTLHALKGLGSEAIAGGH